MVCLLLVHSDIYAQLSDGDTKHLEQMEEGMKEDALQIVDGRSSEGRVDADSVFTRKFVNALKTKYSFYYPFDSLKTVSILEAEDHSFRIFTWQLFINENFTRYHGAIQMNTPNGELKLFPLIDRAGERNTINDSIVDNTNWIGALYYNMVLVKDGNNNKYYTLMGIDDRNFRSTRKIIDILTFRNGKPTFGMNVFDFSSSPTPPKNRNRFYITYKKNAGARLNYDKELKMIIVEHLRSETNEPEKKYTFIPDGDYEGFKWENGYWVYIDRVFTDPTPGNIAPISRPIYDKNGNIIERNIKQRDN